MDIQFSFKLRGYFYNFFYYILSKKIMKRNIDGRAIFHTQMKKAHFINI